jgi:cysteine desulfurase/selenocysteine lyase
MTFPINKIREDFPALHQVIYNRPYIYMDNAATTQKPLSVINAIREYYEKDNCNIHRGAHYMAIRATEAYEETRRYVQRFIHAGSSKEIVFTRGTTESINLVAASYGHSFISKGDEVLISVMEHHSNFVPWQELCRETGAVLKFIPVTETGELDMKAFGELLTDKTKFIAVTHVSNVLGTINPVKEIILKAHEKNAVVLIDGAQAISHLGADVHDLDCDFYCFSGHKMYAPMGTGVLYGKEKYLEMMPPYQTGGEMINEVFLTHTDFNELPLKFEAGTPNVEGVYGLHAAMKYLEDAGINAIRNYEEELLKYATEKLLGIEGLRIIGTSKEKTSVISFLIGGIHPYDAGTIIDKLGIAVRTGHQCAQPLMDWLKIPGTIRASLAFYNTREEIDSLVEAINRVKTMFA